MASKFTDLSFIKTTFRAALVGSWLLVCLYGFITSQVHTYYTSYPDDNIWKKTLVGVVWVLITAHACFSLHAVDNYLVENMFNPLALARNVWSLNMSILIHVIAVGTVMSYFLSNIWYISPKKWRWLISGTILAPVLLHIGYGLFTVTNMFKTDSLMDFDKFHHNAILPMTVLQVVADVMTAAALCLLLREKKTAFARTRSLLRTLMIYAINRCILTATVAAVEMFVLIIDDDAMWYIGCEFLLTDLFATSLITTLNARNRLRDMNAPQATLNMNSFHVSGIRLQTETIVTSESASGGRVTNFESLHKDLKSKSDLEHGKAEPLRI